MKDKTYEDGVIDGLKRAQDIIDKKQMNFTWAVIKYTFCFVAMTYTSICLYEWHQLTVLLTVPLTVMSLLTMHTWGDK